MSAKTGQDKATATRHGSENRQRGKGAVLVRLLPEERALLETKAGDAGLSRAAYMRACALGNAGPRAQRSPSIDRVLVAQLRADLARIGNNLNQLTHAVNQNQTPDIPGLDQTFELVRKAAGQCMIALGYKLHDDD